MGRRSHSGSVGWGSSVSSGRSPAIARAVLVLAMLAASAVLLGPPAAAATIVVDTAADVVDGGDGVTSLREAFSIANTNGTDDVITLAAVDHQLSACGTPELEHTEDSALTITGAGASITQTCADAGILRSTDTAATSVLTVDGITLSGGPNTGSTTDGGAVFGDGRLVLTGVTVTGVDPGDAGSVVASEFGGGPDPTISIQDSTITGNGGRAVAGSFLSASIDGSTITGNEGSGVQLVDGSPLTITDSTVSGNGGRGASTTGQGNTRVTIADSTLSDNAQGGVSCGGCTSLSITDTTVADNGSAATAGTGGGVAFTFDFDPVPVDPSIDIVGSTITGNDARRHGGGLSVGLIEAADDPMSEPIITVQDSQISDNRTLGDDVPGGGISLRTGSLQISGSEVHDNTAGFGGVVPSRGGGIQLAEPFDDGIADGRDLAVGALSISGNSASGRGGGADLELDGRMEASALTVEGNSSGDAGGGLHLAVDRADIDAARITGNAAVDGGGVMARGGGPTSEVVLTRSTVDANTATDRGGGLAVDDVERLDLVNSTVSNNTAADGGGLHIGDDPMDEPETVGARASTIASNSAPVGANVRTVEGTFEHESALIVDAQGGPSCTVSPGTLDALGHTFSDEAACVAAPTDVVDATDVQLGALADNGGATPTRLPAPTSPIGGLVPAASCVEAADQRGVARPQGSGCEPGSVEIVEDDGGPDAIEGTAGPDLLLGTEDADTILGLGGGDWIFASSGGDLVAGGDGGDLLDGATGDDVVRGGSGNDWLFAGPGTDVLEGGPGDDVLLHGPGADTLVGGPGFDVLVGDWGDTLDGGPGPDLCLHPSTSFPSDC